MTASTSDRVRALRTAASVLRKLDEIDSIADFGDELLILEELAEEIAEQGEEDLGPARVREILDAIEAGVA